MQLYGRRCRGFREVGASWSSDVGPSIGGEKMTKHGLSHGMATFVTVIAGGLLVQESHPRLALAKTRLHGLSRWLVEALDLSLEIELISSALLAGALASLWGAAFAIVSRRS